MEAYLWDVLGRLGWSLPSFAIFAVGIWVALRNRAMNPRASRMALFAFVLMLLGLLYRIFLHAWMATYASRPRPTDLKSFGMLYASLTAVGALAELAAWALLLFALHRAFQALPPSEAARPTGSQPIL